MNVTLTAEEHTAIETLTKAEGEFLDLARKTYEAREHFATSFRAMVSFAAKAELEPKKITLILRAAGFVDSRISEFKAIALDPEACERYSTGQIGFKPALEIARTKTAKTSKAHKKQSKKSKLYKKAFQALLDYVTFEPSLKSFTMEAGAFALLAIRKDETEYTSQSFKDSKGKSVAAHVTISAKLSGAK